MPVKKKKEINPWNYLAYTFLGWAMYEAFSRTALYLENEYKTGNLVYSFVVMGAALGLALGVISIMNVHAHAKRQLKMKEKTRFTMESLRPPGESFTTFPTCYKAFL